MTFAGVRRAALLAGILCAPVAGTAIAQETGIDRASVDEALDLIPGANAPNTGGSRNEKLIFVRGFDRQQFARCIVFLDSAALLPNGRTGEHSVNQGLASAALRKGKTPARSARNDRFPRPFQHPVS